MSLSIVTLLSIVAFAAPLDDKADKATADKLVGRWELTKSKGEAPKLKHFIVFEKDGKMTMEIHDGDEVKKFKGKYKAAEKSIDYEITIGDEKKAEKLDIKELKDDDMKTTDPDGIEEEFKRVKEEKKEKKEK